VSVSVIFGGSGCGSVSGAGSAAGRRASAAVGGGHPSRVWGQWLPEAMGAVRRRLVSGVGQRCPRGEGRTVTVRGQSPRLAGEPPEPWSAERVPEQERPNSAGA